MTKNPLVWAGVVAVASLAVVVAQSAYTFVINGKPAKFETMEKGGKVFVDANAFAKALGAQVSFDKATKVFVVTSSGSASATNPAQGTTQLAGGLGELAKAYTLGKNDPLNFTLRSAEYSVTRQTLKDVYAPAFNQKLLILRFTVQNPQKNRDVGFNYSAFKLTAVDDKDVNYVFDCYYARDGETAELSTQLKPAQKVDVVAVWPVAANAQIPKLIVQRGGETGAPVVRYDLGGKIKPLAAPFSDSGFNALEVVKAQSGTYYPMGTLDIKLESVAFSTEALEKRPPAEGKRYLVATFATRSGLANRDLNYSYSNFEINLTDADGSTKRFDDYLVRATRDERAEGTLKPGAETKFRAFFELPADLGAQTLTIAENANMVGKSRTYSFDVSGLK